MNIIVCVKHVPDATADRKFEDDNTVDRVGVDGLLSELDEYAVEQALQLKEKAGEGEVEVTALCVGPEKAVDAVRKALQMGADKGIHVVDDAIAGSDAIATSLVIAQAVEKAGSTLSDDGQRRPGPVRHGLDRRLHERRTRHARGAALVAAGHDGLGDRVAGRPGPHQA